MGILCLCSGEIYVYPTGRYTFEEPIPNWHGVLDWF